VVILLVFSFISQVGESTAFIAIKGNDDFTPENGVVAGSGTKEDPYIIELQIDASGYKYGIQIENTTAHFVIRNCKVKGADWYGVYLNNVREGKIKDCEISHNKSKGILLRNSRANEIRGNIIESNLIGIDLDKSLYNKVSANIVKANDFGIYLKEATSNEIFKNIITKSKFTGLYSDELSFANLIYHNNFIENNVQAWDEGGNQWDNGHEGNHWSNYKGKDKDGDGIGDTPYRIPPVRGYNKDRYPLMKPLE
jgi:nitrous oxidase accessory protein